MTRFTAPDLSRLPSLPLGQDKWADIYAARIADLGERLRARGWAYDVEALVTDLGAVVEDAGAWRELLALTRRDDAIRAVLLSTSWGAFLDHLGASQAPPVVRLPEEQLVAGLSADEVRARDNSYRLRIQLAPEALSTAGPEGAYTFFALATPGVKVVGCYGPMSFGGTRAAPFTPLGQVDLPIVAAAGDGTASAALVAAVSAGLSADERRPIADFVVPSAAVIVPYTVRAVLKVRDGADRELVRAEGERRLRNLVAAQHRPGAFVKLRQLYGAATVHDADGVPLVGDVDLLEPPADLNAVPITPAAPGGAYRAPYCTALTVTAETADD